MPLSAIQKGAIGEFAFLAAAMVTGAGQLEVYTPAADNEGRDAEVRRHLKRMSAVGIQIKVALKAVAHGAQRYLEVRFDLPERKVQNDPRLWYFLAFYDPRQLRLIDPVFLVPSHVFHQLARYGKRNGRLYFEMLANLGPDSHDRWSPYRVELRQLGKRLLEIVDETALMATGALAQVPVEGVWLSRVRPRGGATLRSANVDRKYTLIRKAVLGRDSLTAWYHGHLRLFSPFLIGTKEGEPHVLGYQFAGTSEKPLGPEGSPQNWRCLRLAELTKLKALPGIWHAVPKGKGFQQCIDHVDVSAGRPTSAKRQLRRAA